MVEEDDEETLGALVDADPGPQFKLVVVPACEPRTKPKALNYGLTLAKGDVVAVFDAEDQSRAAPTSPCRGRVRALRAEVACLQAKLSYLKRPEQNLITKWFTIEYAMWFSFFLPGLASLDAPSRWGARRTISVEVTLLPPGGWDPYNVTEDCDLGVRMHREGYAIKGARVDHARRSQQ